MVAERPVFLRSGAPVGSYQPPTLPPTAHPMANPVVNFNIPGVATPLLGQGYMPLSGGSEQPSTTATSPKRSKPSEPTNLTPLAQLHLPVPQPAVVRPNADNQDDQKEHKKTDTIPDGESQYVFEDAVSLADQDIVHVTGNEE